MQDNLNRFTVGCQDDEFGDSSIHTLRRLIRPFPQLTEILRLLDDVKDRVGQIWRRQRIRLWIHSVTHQRKTKRVSKISEKIRILLNETLNQVGFRTNSTSQTASSETRALGVLRICDFD